MITIANPISSVTEYNRIKAAWLKVVEGTSNQVYLDNLGIPTIGIGWNISNDQNLNLFMESSDGLGITHADGQPNQVMTNTDFQALKSIILSYTSQTYNGGGRIDSVTTQESTLIANINAAMHLYPTLANKNFEFASAQKQLDFLNNSTGDAYEDKLLANLRDTSKPGGAVLGANESFPYSYERLALWSLTYNAGSISNALHNALASGDRFDAWFQIRYNFNGNLLAGLAKRRFAESAMFGLYGSGDPALQAQQIIARLNAPVPANISSAVSTAIGGAGLNVLQYMIAYEKYQSYWTYATYNHTHGTNSSTDALGDYAPAITPFANKLAFQDIFKPIASQLMDHYIDNPNINISGLDFIFDGDVNLGLDTNGVIQSQNLNVTGQDKKDLLIATDDTKNNQLSGGKGDDVLIGAKLNDTLDGGDDNDILVGKDGNDILVGGNGYDQLYGGMGNDNLDGGANADHLYGGDGTFAVPDGNDTINGGDNDNANDILEGGAGLDEYDFTGNFGRDVIRDTDGNIVIDGVTLSTLTQTEAGSIVYTDNIASPTYQAIVVDEGDNKSLIISSLAHPGSSITVKNWSNNNLGLNLAPAVAPVRDHSHDFVVNGSTADNSISLTLAGNNASAYTAMQVNGNAGNDLIMGTRTGNDDLSGGDGRDLILSGTNGSGDYGYDTIHGNLGNDYILAAPMRAAAHGDDGNDIIRADLVASIQTSDLNAGDNTRDSVWQDMETYFRYNDIRSLSSKEIPASMTGYASVIPGQNYNIKSLQTVTYLTEPGSWVTEPTTTYSERIEGPYYTDSATGPLNGQSYIAPVQLNTSGYNYLPNFTFASTGSRLFGELGNDSISGGLYSDELSGGAGNDVIWGQNGNDLLDGGADDDKLSGGAGNDTLIGGAGNDLLGGDYSVAQDEGSADLLYGGTGKDTLYGGIGNDYLDGGTGQDILYGESGNNYLYGGDDDNAGIGNREDELYGGENDDVLVMGKGDLADGGAGNNMFIWDAHRVTHNNTPPVNSNNSPAPIANASPNANIFSDVASSPVSINNQDDIAIYANAGNNTLGITGAQSMDDLQVVYANNILGLSTADHQNILISSDQNAAPLNIVFGSSVEQLASTGNIGGNNAPLTDDHFLNGIAPLEQAQITTADLILGRVMRPQNMSVTTGSNYVVGGLVNDSLTASVGGSKMVGGRGDDTLNGGLGNDVYLIRKGDGLDTITEKGGSNTIKFDVNISESQVTLKRDAEDLMVVVSSDQTIRIKNAFNPETGALINASAIPQISFSNGHVWDINKIKEQLLAHRDDTYKIFGFETDDTLSFDNVTDQLDGGAGNDTYTFSADSTIYEDHITDSSGNDTLKLLGGVVQSQVHAYRSNKHDLVLVLDDVNGSENAHRIVIENAFDDAGNFTNNTIENIIFSDSSSWNFARIQSEVAKSYVSQRIGSDGDDSIYGSDSNTVMTGGKGNDNLWGHFNDDTYKYALGDGKDVIQDSNGNDVIEFTSGILQSNVTANINGTDLVLNISDGGSITVKDMFLQQSLNIVDPRIISLLEQLSSNWLPRAEALIEKEYGMVGNGNLVINFVEGTLGGGVANIAYSSEGSITLQLELADFSILPNGTGSQYYDRMIAHEMVHAISALNMDITSLPGWLVEGMAEYIVGADDRALIDLHAIPDQNTFNSLFKTTSGSPSSSTEYTVSYIAVKLLDQEIRANGGAGIKDLFAQLKIGLSLDQSLSALSTTYGGMGGLWNNLQSFESHFQSVGFSSLDSVLNLNNADVGSIAGSDNGNPELDPYGVIADSISDDLISHFNLIIPQEYYARTQIVVNPQIETIKFSDGSSWDLARIIQEASKIVGTSGNDTILDPSLNSSLSGREGDDIIFGYAGNDTLFGDSGNDSLYGGNGNDFLSGGTGNDLLSDEWGDDTYIYALGDGKDTLTDYAGTDVLRLNVLPSDIILSRKGTSDFQITFSDAGSIIVTNGLDANGIDLSSRTIDSIEFSNGSTWNRAQIQQKLYDAPSIQMGTSGNDNLSAGVANTTLMGLEGNDSLQGYTGNDSLIGGVGKDLLKGGLGNDVYYFNLGDSQSSSSYGFADEIYDTGGSDTIKFGEGISESDVVIRFVTNPYISGLYIYSNNSEGIKISNMFDLQTMLLNPNNAIENIEFANGHVWNLDRIMQEALKSSPVSESINGFASDDVYQFNRGGGSDTISDYGGNDTLKLGQGITEANVFLRLDQYTADLNVFLDTGESIKIKNEFDYSSGAVNPNNAIETIQFANGQTWDLARIQAETLRASSRSDTIYGYPGDDVISGGKGFDSLVGSTGNDTYQYALGDGLDYIQDTGGIDSISFAAGILPENVSVYQRGNDLFLAFANGDGIKVLGAYTNGAVNAQNSIENIVFKSGTVWGAAAIQQKIIDAAQNTALIIGANTWDELHPSGSANYVLNGMAGDDDITGTAGNDTLIGGGGWNLLNGQGGNDTYLINGEPGLHIITSFHGAVGDTDKVLFSSGKSPNDVQVVIIRPHVLTDLVDGVRYQNNDPQLSSWELLLRTGQESVLLRGLFESDPGTGGAKLISNAAGFGTVEFIDGTVWDINELMRRAILDTDASTYLNGTASADSMSGLKGDDNLYGYDGNDTLNGGLGNDALRGGRGDDVYQYFIGDGSDNIYDFAGNDRLEFGPGITKDDIVFKGDSRNLYISFKNSTDTIGINDWLNSWTVESIKLADGSIINSKDILNSLVSTGASVTAGIDQAGVISGTATPDSYVYFYYIDSATNSVVTINNAVSDVTTGAYSFKPPSNLLDGRDIYATAWARNTSQSSAAVVVKTRDMLAPAMPFATLSSDGLVLSGTAEANSTVIITNSQSVELGRKVVDNQGAYSINLAQPLLNGQMINVVAVDMAGNISPGYTLIALDKTAPAQPTAAFDSTGKIITGIAEASSSVIVKNASGAQIGSATADATTGTYSITLSTALINSEIVNVTAQDFSGNISVVKTINAPDKTAPTQPTAAFDTTGKIITGTAEANSTVIVKNSGGTQIGTATANATTGAYSITLSTALINKETVNVTAKDAAGNISTAKAITAPDLTAPTQPTAAFDTTGKIITGTAEASSTVIVKSASGTQIGTATANASTGAYSITLSTALINAELVNVTAKDAAGNISVVKAINAPDKTAPAIPTAAFDTTGKIITGTAEVNSTVIVKNSGGTQIGTATANATTGAYSITLSTALINKETVNVTAKDAAGNTSTAAAIIAPDLTAPTQPTAAFDTTGKIITGTAEASSTVIVKNAGGTQIGTATANASTGAYSITLSTALLNAELVNVTAKDTAGNISVVRAINAPDKTAPAIPTAAFDTTGKIITGAAEANSTVIVKNSGGTQIGTATANATTGAYSITLSTALINKETVNVTAKDAAGNISTAKAIIAPDLTAPTQPTAAFDTTGKIITGTAEASSTVIVKNAGGTQIGTATANASTGAYSITLSTALLNFELVNVTAKDAAGNISVVRAINAPDKTAPAAPTGTFNAAGKIVTGTAEIGSTVTIKNSANTTTLGTATADASGNYSITLATALTHKETVNVTAKDPRGNVSVAKVVTAPLLAAAPPMHVSATAQMDALLHAMASFAPPAASETQPLVPVSDSAHPMLVAHS